MKIFLRLTLFTFLILNNTIINAQSNPQALDASIQINRILTVKNGVIRVALDPISKNLFYIQTGGKLYEVIRPTVGAAYDSLVDSTAHHSVTYVQGMVFHDSTLYISGNQHDDSSKTAGIIVRGKLLPNGGRQWDTLMITQYYQTADYFDHLFSGVTVSPSGDSIYINSGARGDHGEVQTRYGIYPGLRNVPLTSAIFAFPTNDTNVIVLKNDSVALDTSGYLYCRGVRNHFDLAFDSQNHLFGVENSGDRDHNEEMNWLQKNHHYGFPWRMGDTENPQQHVPFNPATDKLINHFSRSWRLGFFSNDPTFPQAPLGLVFDNPIQNYGPDCDKYRDTSGHVLDASDSSISIGTFTAHRSPLGLVFDNSHVLSQQYNGDAFMLSWTKGYDSCGCSTPPDTSIGPFVDPSQDLVHLDLSFDSTAGNFRLNATRIISEFEHPVDADIDSNKIYVIENGYGGTSGLYEVILPGAIPPLPCNPSIVVNQIINCDPDSNEISISAFGTVPNYYSWYDSSWALIEIDTSSNGGIANNLSTGSYYVVLTDQGTCSVDTLTFEIPDEVNLTIDSVIHTTCIGCNNGVIYFTRTGGVSPVLISVNSNILPLTNVIGALQPGFYTICAIDANQCISCDTITVFEDPTGIVSNDVNKNIYLYPNPTSKNTILKFNGGGKTLIKLLDSNGRQIKLITDEELNPGVYEKTIDCSNLAKGIYSLEIISDSKLSKKKLVIN